MLYESGDAGQADRLGQQEDVQRQDDRRAGNRGDSRHPAGREGDQAEDRREPACGTRQTDMRDRARLAGGLGVSPALAREFLERDEDADEAEDSYNFV